MHTLMFVNGLDRVNICYVSPDPASYGKFQLAYCKGGRLHEYSYHIKCGFKSAAEAIGWYFERYPDGNVLDQQNFLGMQHQLLELKLPSPQANTFNPLHMDIREPPRVAKRDRTGKLLSDFE